MKGVGVKWKFNLRFGAKLQEDKYDFRKIDSIIIIFLHRD